MEPLIGYIFQENVFAKKELFFGHLFFSRFTTPPLPTNIKLDRAILIYKGAVRIDTCLI